MKGEESDDSVGFSTKPLLWILAVFLCVFLFLVVLSRHFSTRINTLDNLTNQENARLLIAEEIITTIQEIEKHIYQLLSTPGTLGRQRIARLTLTHISQLEHDLQVLEKGGTVKRVIPLNLEGQDDFIREILFQPPVASSRYHMEVIEVAPYLDQMRSTVSRMLSLLDRQETYHHGKGDLPPDIMSEITLSLKTLPPFFLRVTENANRMLYESNNLLKKNRYALALERNRYQQTVYAGICLVIMTITVAGILSYRQMQSSNLRLRGAWEAMRRARDDAELASRSKTEFLANMSHEIRTPMNGVLGLTELLLHSDLDDKQRRYATTIFSCGNSLLTLLNDILDLSRIEAGKLELNRCDFNLKQTVDDVGQLFCPAARSKGNELKVQVADDLPAVVQGDHVRLRQTLVNLVGNAVKFTSQGRIGIEAVAAPSPPAEEGSPLRVKFSVTDTGIGIDPEKQHIIFETFTQADPSMSRSHGGTGLGLAISKQLVEMMGGVLRVESAPGRGATFFFTLPLEPAAPHLLNHDLSSPYHVSALREETTFRRVLLVEDNPVNLDLASEMLDILGYRVDVAQDGLEATAKAGDVRYDLILMDCQMPKLDGYEATRRIRVAEISSGRTRMPIVALTGHAMTGERERCLEAGMDDFLSKPFTFSELQEMVRKWVNPMETETGEMS